MAANEALLEHEFIVRTRLDLTQMLDQFNRLAPT